MNLSGIWAKRDQLQDRLERASAERRAIAEEQRLAEQRQKRRQELLREIDFIAGQFCGFKVVSEFFLESWAAAIREIEVSGSLVELDKTHGIVSCQTYVANQAQVKKGSRESPETREWLEKAVREGLRREQDPWPADVPRAVLPPRALQPVESPRAVPPPRVDPPSLQSRKDEPQPPERPRCRYQGPWCD